MSLVGQASSGSESSLPAYMVDSRQSMTKDSAQVRTVSPQMYTYDELPPQHVSTISKTAHKLAEERGEHADEPLLIESKRRFVLFPIQDSEVSTARFMLKLRARNIPSF